MSVREGLDRQIDELVAEGYSCQLRQPLVRLLRAMADTIDAKDATLAAAQPAVPDPPEEPLAVAVTAAAETPAVS